MLLLLSLGIDAMASIKTSLCWYACALMAVNILLNLSIKAWQLINKLSHDTDVSMCLVWFQLLLKWLLSILLCLTQSFLSQLAVSNDIFNYTASALDELYCIVHHTYQEDDLLCLLNSHTGTPPHLNPHTCPYKVLICLTSLSFTIQTVYLPI